MPPEPLDPDSPLSAELAPDDFEVWAGGHGPDDEHTLVDLVNRVLDKGVVISGEITISVAGVDLVYLGLNALLTSVSTARRVLADRAAAELEAGGRPAAG